MVVRVSTSGRPATRRVLAVAAAAFILAGCQTLTTVSTHGYVMREGTLEQVPIGSSRELVRLALGTPSTTSTPGGAEAWYYISQTVQQTAFLPPRIIDQRVLVIYFDAEGRVRDIANYGLVDGRVFDFVDRVTPTGGTELNFIAQLLGAAAMPSI